MTALCCGLLLIASCSQEEEASVVPIKNSINSISADDLPTQVIETLSIGLLSGGTDQLFSQNNVNYFSGNLDLDRIMMSVEESNARHYSIPVYFEHLGTDPLTFYNLVIPQNATGTVSQPYVMRYTMAKEFAERLVKGEANMTTFTGKIAQISLTEFMSNSTQQSTANLGGSYNSTADPCPSDDRDVNNGSSTTDSGNTDNGSNGNNSGGTGGSDCEWVVVDYEEEIDCTVEGRMTNCEVINTAIYAFECDGPINNNSDSGECVDDSGLIPITLPQLVLDPKLKTHPCARAVIADLTDQSIGVNIALLLEQANGFNAQSIILPTFINFFANSATFDLHFIVDDAGKDGDGNDLNAKTDRLGYSAYGVTLDPNYLNSASNLAIARTIYHESLHAYMSAALHRRIDGNLAASLRDLYNQEFAGQENAVWQTQHEFMSHYVDAIALTLQNFDQGRQDLGYYRDLAWGGLQNSPTFQGMSQEEQDRINQNILNEHENNEDAKGEDCSEG